MLTTSIRFRKQSKIIIIQGRPDGRFHIRSIVIFQHSTITSPYIDKSKRVTYDEFSSELPYQCSIRSCQVLNLFKPPFLVEADQTNFLDGCIQCLEQTQRPFVNHEGVHEHKISDKVHQRDKPSHE